MQSCSGAWMMTIIPDVFERDPASLLSGRVPERCTPSRTPSHYLWCSRCCWRPTGAPRGGCAQQKGLGFREGSLFRQSLLPPGWLHSSGCILEVVATLLGDGTRKLRVTLPHTCPPHCSMLLPPPGMASTRSLQTGPAIWHSSCGPAAASRCPSWCSRRTRLMGGSGAGL